jgi:hypothetical protein
MGGLRVHSSAGRDAAAHPGWRGAMSARAIAAVLAVAMLTATAGAQQPGADGPSKALEGRWKLELYLDKASARTEPMAGQINGEIAFSSKAWWTPSDRFGRHDLNLRSFFGSSFLRPDGVTAFGPGDTSMVTEASGYVRGDSVGIDFIPRVDHGGLSLWGRFWGDSAKGEWYRRGADGEGHFVLRRESREAVDVANVPDGRPAAVAAAPPPKPLTKAEARALAKKEAAAKAKARRDSIAVARADAKAKRDSVARARVATRDSARAVAAAGAKAKRDSVAQAKVAAAAATKERATTRVAAGGAAGASGAAAPNALVTPAATTAPAPSAAPPSTTPGTPGALRVRIFDEASKRFFVTTYSLHLPDGHWMYGNLRTGNGPDGWGPAVARPPGNYEIEIANFKCGDKLYFFKDKILKPVTVDSTASADVTINVDLPDAAARPSLDNRAGASCTEPPPPQPGD